MAPFTIFMASLVVGTVFGLRGLPATAGGISRGGKGKSGTGQKASDGRGQNHLLKH
jgi:hypothetical protein